MSRIKEERIEEEDTKKMPRRSSRLFSIAIAKPAKPPTLRMNQSTAKVLKPLSSALNAPPAKKRRSANHTIPVAAKEDARPVNRRNPRQSNGMLLAVVKDEPLSREGSVDPSPRPDDAQDGRVKGEPLKMADRFALERNSRVLYPYPSFINRRGKLVYVKNRALDLMLDGETDGGENEVGKAYTIDCILAMDESSALIDWTGYKYPTWDMKQRVCKGSATTDFTRRMKMLDPVWRNLAMTEPMGKFLKKYPNYRIRKTLAYGDYVKHPGIAYLSGLRKRERQINELYERHHGLSGRAAPMITFVDWTNFKKSFIPRFEYIVDSVLTEEAKAIDADLMANTKSCICTTTCKSVDGCCAEKSKANFSYVSKGRLANTVRVRGKDADKFTNPDDYVDVYECGDACACDKKKCFQRTLQNGHRNKFICFMHHERGWTMLAGNDIAACAYISEYVGVVSTVNEAQNIIDRTYQMELDVKVNAGTAHQLIIDANEKGNESRFFAHSCEPNMFTSRINFDIDGRPKRHIGLFASRDIKAGEELTFDYHADITDPVEFKKRVNFTCKCGSTNCREKAYKRQMRRRAARVIVKIE